MKRDFIQSHDIATVVTVIDRIYSAEVCDYLAAHHNFLMASIYEEFPVSLFWPNERVDAYCAFPNPRVSLRCMRAKTAGRLF